MTKNILPRTISKKERSDMYGALYREFRKNPFIEIGYKLFKSRKIWFEFLEQLTITGFIAYLTQKTGNFALRLLLIITMGYWFFVATAFIFSLRHLLLLYVFKKERYWWRWWTVVLALSITAIYLVTNFLDLFKVLH